MSRITYDILGVVSPAAASIAKPSSGDPSLFKSIIPGAALGVTGYVVWDKHPVLGFLAGDAVGLNAYRTYRGMPGDRVRAATNVATSASAITGSLLWQRHPFWGWVAGLVAGSAVMSFVKGSAAHRLLEAVRR